MGKNIISQRRGRGTPSYRSRSFRFKGDARYQNAVGIGIIKDIVNCPGHSAPLVKVQLSNQNWILIGGEGLYVGQEISVGAGTSVKSGDVMPLKDLPLGAMVYNLESRPGDGGKFVRASGTFAKIVAKTSTVVTVKLPSKNSRKFNPLCRATMGRVAGSGRVDKPLVKAGKRHHKIRARGGLYPKTSGVAMNAVDHPFGGSSSSHKGTPTVAPRNAPAGRKVGKIRPRRTGKR